MSFVWMRKRGPGRFKIVRQVILDEGALEKIADILKIPPAQRVPGTMYVASLKPPSPPSRRSTTPRRPRERK